MRSVIRILKIFQSVVKKSYVYTVCI